MGLWPKVVPTSTFAQSQKLLTSKQGDHNTKVPLCTFKNKCMACSNLIMACMACGMDRVLFYGTKKKRENLWLVVGCKYTNQRLSLFILVP
jgi:hypothetical protein